MGDVKQGDGSHVTDAMAYFQSGQSLEVTPLVGTFLCPSEDPWVSRRHSLWCDPQKTFLSVFPEELQRSSLLYPEPTGPSFFFSHEKENSPLFLNYRGCGEHCPQPSALLPWEELGTVMAPIPFFPLKSFHGIRRHGISPWPFPL